MLEDGNIPTDADVIIRPPSKLYKNHFSYYPLRIGDYTHIGQGSLVEAAQIGSFVHIGSNCVIVLKHINLGRIRYHQRLCMDRRWLDNSTSKRDSSLLFCGYFYLSQLGTKEGDSFASVIKDLSECWDSYRTDSALKNYKTCSLTCI